MLSKVLPWPRGDAVCGIQTARRLCCLRGYTEKLGFVASVPSVAPFYCRQQRRVGRFTETLLSHISFKQTRQNVIVTQFNVIQQYTFYPYIFSVYPFRERTIRAGTVLKETTSRRYNASHHIKSYRKPKARRKLITITTLLLFFSFFFLEVCSAGNYLCFT